MSTAPPAPQVDLLTTQQNFTTRFYTVPRHHLTQGRVPIFTASKLQRKLKKRTLKNMLPKSPTDPIKVGQDYRFKVKVS